MIINKATITLGILAGTAIGATIGVLLAPEKGSATRDKLKKEATAIKEQFVSDAKEVKDDLTKTATSGKETLKKEFVEVATKASHKTDRVITFLEKQLAILKEKNKNLQKTT
ncbi:YtxH domain-containing protein [Algibacter sp.]|uniref:YtxH domain-containing protein n=1 Tax=Algibacter sp. TaxID=1872428 RepID=UPI003C74C2CB